MHRYLFSGSSLFLTCQDSGFLSFDNLDQVFLLPTSITSWHTAVCSVLCCCNASVMHMGEWKQNKQIPAPKVSFYNGSIRLLHHNWVYHQFLRICVRFCFGLAWLKEFWDSGHVCSMLHRFYNKSADKIDVWTLVSDAPCSATCIVM